MASVQAANCEQKNKLTTLITDTPPKRLVCGIDYLGRQLAGASSMHWKHLKSPTSCVKWH